MKSRIYRQFHGFLNTPALFLNSDFLEFSLFKSDIKALKIDFNVFENIHFSTNMVLGKRMEEFFKLRIIADSNYQLLANNIQIQNKERTLGELDFIIKDITKEAILHVELMYKFYVYDPDISEEMKRWIGPNRKDSLLQKIEKVKKNQFPLINLSETKDFLSSLHINSETIEQEICFKAMLFIPEKFKNHDFPYINTACVMGFWFHIRDFRKYQNRDFEFYEPEKQDWPINPHHDVIWYSFEEILEQIKSLHLRKKSPLIWIKKEDGSFERIIVVWW